MSGRMKNLLGRRLAELTATRAMANSRAPQRAMMRTVMFGTTVKETRMMHADMTNIPEASNMKTPTRLYNGTLSVQSRGTGIVSKSASLDALKQLSATKKVNDAVHFSSGSGRTSNLLSYGRHIRLSCRVVEMNPTIHTTIVKLRSCFCQSPNASRR